MLTKSIVSRTSLTASLLSGAVSIIIMGIVFEAQQSLTERRLAAEISSNLRSVVASLLQRTPSGEHRRAADRLEDLRAEVERQPHVRYAYLVQPKGKAASGATFVWEPPIPDQETATAFTAPRTFAEFLPDRIKPYERLILAKVELPCMGGDGCAQLRAVVSTETVAPSLRRLRLALVVSALLISLSTGIIVFLTVRRFLTPLREISERMRKLASAAGQGGAWASTELSSRDDDPQETRFFRESLQQFTAAMNRARALESELNVNRSLADLARQVAHDIRSPLAALESAVGRFDGLPKEKSEIVDHALTRIREIASGLLRNKMPSQLMTSETNEDGGSYRLGQTLRDLIEEKRIQYAERAQLVFSADIEPKAENAYSDVSRTELGRVLSNLIDNAVEAARDEGRIVCSLSHSERGVLIAIKDNGRGIAVDVLPQIFRQGFSHGKTDGSGLGLYHARNTIEAWGGSITITSELAHGTNVTVQLPVARPPAWMPLEIAIGPDATVVVCDDDPSIHAMWQDRFNELLRITKTKLQVCNFYDSDACIAWYRTQGMSSPGLVFLVDYDLRGTAPKGTQMIAELDVARRAILVTSHGDTDVVLDACLTTGLALLPKDLAPTVAICVAEFPSRVDAVLIDDDPWLRESWSAAFKDSGQGFVAFATAREFLARCHLVQRETPIFIDFHLQGESGDELGHRLFLLGYTELYLATGMSAKDLPRRTQSWARGVVGKEAPFDLLKNPRS